MEEPLERLRQATAFEGVAAHSFAFGHESSLIPKRRLYPSGPSVQEPGVAIDNLGGRARSIRPHDLAARLGEAALECALETPAVEEPERALAFGLPEAHLALVLHSRSVEVGAGARQRAGIDVAFVPVAIREVVDALALRLAVRERALDAIAVLGVVAPLALRLALVHLAFVAVSAHEAVDADAFGLTPGERSCESFADLRHVADHPLTQPLPILPL